MIIENGYIQFYSEPSSIEYGTDGLPRPTSGEWGETIPCQWRLKNKNLQAKSAVSGNAVVVSTYEVLFNDCYTYSERCKLFQQDGSEIGEFSVIQDEHLHLLQLYRLYI